MSRWFAAWIMTWVDHDMNHDYDLTHFICYKACESINVTSPLTKVFTTKQLTSMK